MSAAVAGSLSVGTSAASTRVYAVIVLTGVAMGMRNATIRRLGEREVNTTVLTMTLTAIGSDSMFAGGSNQGARRRFGFVMSVLAGAAVGALLLRFSAWLTLGVAGAARVERMRHCRVPGHTAALTNMNRERKGAAMSAARRRHAVRQDRRGT